ncbi:MAG TPA: hypothetical protein VK666_04120 [Chryseolinea sp.]|nr:hypothetical protein [Chryseolinea sp.]
MNGITLNWTNFDWSKFQTLSVQLAEAQFPDCNFEEYLKQGQKQDGLDLLAFNRRDGSFLGVQCKKVEKLTVNNIENIIDEFQTGHYKDKLSFFILSTTADLQSKKMQIELNKQKQILLAKNIGFECWDRQILETRLKNLWSLVAYYFGKQQADEFCYPQLKNSHFAHLTAVEDYISRNITMFANDQASSSILSYRLKKAYTLTEIFLSDRLQTRRICIIGDAYQGKSVYLRQVAFDLKNAGQRIQPLLLEIKASNIQPLEILLSNQFGAWKSIPFKDVIIFIDGLDEAPTDKFAEIVKYINEFSSAYRSVNMVLSCRKLFFNFYEVHKDLPFFDIYELNGLTSENIDSYLQGKLTEHFHRFKDDIYKNDLLALLYQPFYLVNLATDYLNPPHKLAGSKLKVLDSVIERSILVSYSRQLKGSDRIKMSGVQFKRTIELFAFCLQLAGLNAFKYDQVQELFSRDDQVLLQHNSLLLVTGDYWSFNNALFQEHLAASFLSKLSYEQIISHCAIGTSHPKIKTKWIQTFSSALSLLEQESNIFIQLLNFIEKDNIELVFLTERSKYTPALRLLFLTKLISKCKAQNIRPLIVYEETIGVFLETAPESNDFLMDCIEDATTTDLIKIVCARILKNSLLPDIQQQRFANVARTQIEHTFNGNYAASLIEILSVLKSGGISIIRELIDRVHLSAHHEYRDKLYELITVLELVDEFYDYGLEGISFFVNHNKNTSHGGSEVNLQEFLLSTANRRHLTKLLEKSKQDDSLTYFDYRGNNNNQFLRRLFEKLSEVFERDPLIILPIARFIKDMGRRYLRQETKELDAFLDKTNSYSLIIRLLIKDIMVDNDWELGTLITEDSYDYILWEYEEGGYSVRSLQTCLTGVRYKNKNEMNDTFFQLCVDVTGGEMENKKAAELYRISQEAETQKRKNDLLYIQSSVSFQDGIKTYFDHYGRKSIPEEELYVEIDPKTIRQQSDSYFLFEFISKWVPPHDKKVTLKDCLKLLGKPQNFETFRAEEIMDYPFADGNAKQILYPLLEDYYKKTLPTANFTNAMWIENDRFRWLRKELQLGEIFRKFKFDTPVQYLLELVWLDNGGTRSFETSELNDKQSISQLVLERLDSPGVQLLKKKIFQNMKNGIKLEEVLGNHIALCKKLKIFETKDLILTCVKDNSKDNTLRLDATTIYLELGGDIENIVRIFVTMTDYNAFYFLHLAFLIAKTQPDIIIDVVTRALHDDFTNERQKIQFAELLAEIGN